nr:unnamed protein product [Digitaria exilis]
MDTVTFLLGSQMDKASIIKDAIEYIQQLQEEERQVLQEVRAMDPTARVDKKPKRARSTPSFVVDGGAPPPPPPPVEVLELRVSEVGDRVLVVSVTCSKRRDAMARVCRAIEGLRLHVITATITSVAGCLMHTVFVETIGMRWAC